MIERQSLKMKTNKALSLNKPKKYLNCSKFKKTKSILEL